MGNQDKGKGLWIDLRPEVTVFPSKSALKARVEEAGPFVLSGFGKPRDSNIP